MGSDMVRVTNPAAHVLSHFVHLFEIPRGFITSLCIELHRKGNRNRTCTIELTQSFVDCTFCSNILHLLSVLFRQSDISRALRTSCRALLGLHKARHTAITFRFASQIVSNHKPLSSFPYPYSKSLSIYLKTLPSARGQSLPSTVVPFSQPHASSTNWRSSGLLASSLVKV